MERVVSILEGVPVWVYFALAYGIYSGVRAWSPRWVSAKRLLVLPLVFVGISLSSLVSRLESQPLVAVLWGLCLVLGAILGWFFLTTEPLELRRDQGTIKVKGTPVVLVLFLVIFVVKFVYGYEMAVDPAGASEPDFLLEVFGASGLATGVMVARNAKLYMDYTQDIDRTVS